MQPPGLPYAGLREKKSRQKKRESPPYFDSFVSLSRTIFLKKTKIPNKIIFNLDIF